MTAMPTFYDGVACGRKVVEAHADTKFESPEQRSALWWFSAGMLAVGEFSLTSLNDVQFMAGLATQAPSIEPHDQVDEDYDDECEGHESTSGPIGNTTYCDGSCRPKARTS